MSPRTRSARRTSIATRSSSLNGIIFEPARLAHPAFRPGCVFVTPPFTGHGVSGRAIRHARALTDAAADAPVFNSGSLWFQLETALVPSFTPWSEPVDDWAATWGSHRSYFE